MGDFRPINKKIVVAIGTKVQDRGYQTCKSAGAIWYGDGDARNEGLRGMEEAGDDALECAGEMLCRVFQNTKPTTPLEVGLSNSALLRVLTAGLKRAEDSGWHEFKAVMRLRTLAGMPRSRQAATTLRALVKKTDAHTLHELNILVDEGMSKAHTGEAGIHDIDCDPVQLTASGVRLSESLMSQSRAYGMIMSQKKVVVREPKRIMLERTRASVEEPIGR